MPRNVEYLLDRYLEENNFPQFILTFAIQQRIVVPEKILKQFGGGYGFDNFFSSFEYLEAKRKELLEVKKPSNRFEKFSEEEVEQQIEKEYQKELAVYNNNLYRYQEAIGNLKYMLNKTTPLIPSNKLQEQFKKKVLKFLSQEILKVKKQYAKKLVKPERMDRSLFIKNHNIQKESEYHQLKKHIKSIEKELLVDPVLSEEIARDWLGLSSK